MYVFYTLVSRFLAGERLEGVRTSVRAFPAEAIDANLVFDRYLFLLMPDEVLRFDLNSLNAAGEHARPTAELGTWSLHF